MADKPEGMEPMVERVAEAIAACDPGHNPAQARLYARAALQSANVEGLVEALREALIWHEQRDKALSKQPPNPARQWDRAEHQEQIAALKAALAHIKEASNDR